MEEEEAGKVGEDAFVAAEGAGCSGGGHRARCVTRSPPGTSVTDLHTRSLQIPTGLSFLLHDCKNNIQ